MEEIKEWLSSGTDYSEGVKLFELHSENKVLINQLKRASHNFNYKKLVAGLKEILQAAKPKEKPIATPPKKGDDVPESVKQLFDQRRMLHTELWHKPSAYERKVIAFKILAISRKISNYYSGSEEDEKQPDPLPDDKAQLITRRNNNRAYISKNRNKENKAAEVKRREAENQEIEKLINGDS